MCWFGIGFNKFIKSDVMKFWIVYIWWNRVSMVGWFKYISYIVWLIWIFSCLFICDFMCKFSCGKVNFSIEWLYVIVCYGNCGWVKGVGFKNICFCFKVSGVNFFNNLWLSKY